MLIHGVELIDSGDMVIQHQKQTGRPFEHESIKVWTDMCCDGATVLDIGAYTGLYGIAAARKGANVVCFEPNARVFNRLEENIRINNVDITAYNSAIGENCCTVSMILNPGVTLTSGGKVKAGGDIVQVTVDSLYLDVDAIKIDVEGYELSVLRGAIETIKRCMPVIISEALDDKALKDQEAFLSTFGYSYVLADERNVIWSL